MELGDQVERSVANIVDSASELIASLKSAPSERRRVLDDKGRGASFGAFEAKRLVEPINKKKIDQIFYVAFLAITLLSPLFVVLTFGQETQEVGNAARAVGWDMIGIFSTVILLAYTFGIYAVGVLSAAGKDFIIAVVRVAMFGGLGNKIVNFIERYTPPEKSGRVTAFTIALFILGLWLSWIAIQYAFDLYHRSIASPVDIVKYNSIYIKFFITVVFLTLLFVAMDVFVAFWEASHNKTVVAASSAVHATGPMLFSISVMSIYILLEYNAAGYAHPKINPAKYISVEFISGALSFQMIFSNILFIVIKQNLFVKLVHRCIESTTEP